MSSFLSKVIAVPFPAGSGIPCGSLWFSLFSVPITGIIPISDPDCQEKPLPVSGSGQTVEKPCHSEPVRTLAWESPGFSNIFHVKYADFGVFGGLPHQPAGLSCNDVTLKGIPGRAGFGGKPRKPFISVYFSPFESRFSSSILLSRLLIQIPRAVPSHSETRFSPHWKKLLTACVI